MSSSQVIQAQTDEDTFFVLVDDTVSLQSFDSDDKQETGDRNFCLLDKPNEEYDTNSEVHDFVDVPSFGDEINEQFLDELMAAMDDEDVHILLNEADDEEDKNNESIVRELLIDAEPNVHIDSTFLDADKQLDKDNISITSCHSELSNKSFVFVQSKDQSSSIEDTNEQENVETIKLSASSTGSNSDVSLQRRSDHSSYSERTVDTISMDGLENPSLEYDDMWQFCTQTPSPMVTEEPQKVLIRELSYDDELRDAEGIDLMAPVFLAITGEPCDHVNDMKRKAKSIEDLCSVSLNSDKHRLRSVSDVTFQRNLKSKYTKGKKASSLEKIIDNEDMKTSFDDTDGVLLKTSIKSYLSFDDLHLSSVSSGGNLYDDDDYDDNETFVDPDAYIDSIYEDEDIDYDFTATLQYPSDEVLENVSFSSWRELSGSECASTKNINNCEDKIEVEPTPPSPSQAPMLACKDKSVLKRSPSYTPGIQCGFLEYPYGERSPVGSPQKVRCLVSCNTSPTSPPVETGGVQKRIVVNINGEQRIIDMKLIAPYLKVLSHGGHHRIGNECHDIVVFTACFLPDKTLKNYKIIMEQLFFYCIHAVDVIVTNTYEIVFFNSALESKNMPARKWIKKYYDMVFYKLKKNLKNIYFVHQSLWLKAALRFSKLFVSNKFRQKIHLIQNIQVLQEHIPLDYIFIPQTIYKIDETFQ